MNSKLEGKLLTAFFEGHVDSANADAVGEELNAVLADSEYENLVLDMEKLDYISSAGLRVILRTRQKNPTLKIVNVKSEVYEVFEMTGFTEMMPVEKAYKQYSIDGCAVVGEGAKGIVYRYNGDTIIKVYKDNDSLPDIQNERDLARKAFVLGIPTAISYDICKVGDKFGSVFELLEAKSYSKMIVNDPDNFDKYVTQYAELLKLIHSTPVKADDMPDFKKKVYSWLKYASKTLKPEVADAVKALIDETPDTLNMLHCDYHSNNVMYQNGEAILIDMDTLSHGHPIFELCNVYITYKGFAEYDKSNPEGFLKMPWQTAAKVWDKFIRVYLGTDDEARINDVETKTKLLNYVRIMNHYTKRGALETAEGKAVLDSCAKHIEELLKVVTTLDF